MPELATVHTIGKDVAVEVVDRWSLRGVSYARVRALEGKPFGWGKSSRQEETYPSELLENVQICERPVTAPGSAE